MTNATLIRFIEAFIAVFVVALAADPIFGQPVDLFGDVQSLAVAIVSAAILAVRRVLATRSE